MELCGLCAGIVLEKNLTSESTKSKPRDSNHGKFSVELPNIVTKDSWLGIMIGLAGDCNRLVNGGLLVR